MLLADVRNRLDGYLYSQNPTQTLADAEPSKVVRKATRITPLKLLCYGPAIALLAYASAARYLHDQSRALRNAILARTPPQPRKINIMETLPQPLPQILSEGWLEVRADPRGWLLIFTSDGAFATGQSKLSEEFKRNATLSVWGSAGTVAGRSGGDRAYRQQTVSQHLQQLQPETVGSPRADGGRQAAGIIGQQ